MFSVENLNNWSFLYAAELISFSIALSFLLSSNINRSIIIWITSNIFAVLGMMTPSTFFETNSNLYINKYSYLFSIISLTIPYFAIKYRFHKSLYSNIIISFCIICWIIAIIIPYGWMSSVISYAASAIVAMLCAYSSYKNRLWRGLWGHNILVVGFIACAALILWRAWTFFDARLGDGFNVSSSVSILGLQLLVFNSLFLQIGFLGVVVGHGLRERRFQERRAARNFELSRAIIEEEQRLEAVADERLNMLSLLTHEVRQPINNAQAALEALRREVRETEPMVEHRTGAIDRAQTVLDSVTLSISNAILGVSLLDNANAAATRPVNAIEIAELARSDCPLEQRFRIRMAAFKKPIYADLDPVLVRLALRNLLDNALKYSPISSLVELDIVHDEVRLGVSFRVQNRVSNPDLLSKDIFGQHVRGKGVKSEGSGLGLFLVRKVAEAHHGSITFSVDNDADVTFDLFLPD